MSERNVVLWTSRIMSNYRKGLYDNAMCCFLQMRREGIEPNERTYSAVLSACAQSINVEFGSPLHAVILKTGYMRQLFVSSGLISVYSKSEQTNKARQLFDEMPERDDVSWNTMISGYAHQGVGEEAFGLFSYMISDRDWKSFVNDYTLASAVKACANMGSLRLGESLHCYAIRSGFVSNVFVGGSIVDMYRRCDRLDNAHRMFNLMEDKDVVTWNSMITAYAQNDHEEEALELFYRMNCSSISATDTTFSCVLKASTVMPSDELGRCLHAKAFKYGFLADVYVGTAVVDMYSKFLEMGDAGKAFGEMKERNLVSYNALMTGCGLAGECEKSLRMYEVLRMEGMKPDLCTLVGLFSACAGSCSLLEGAQIHSHSIHLGLDLNVSVANATVNLYLKCRSIDCALKIFESIQDGDAVSWAGIISGLVQNDRGDKALELFCQMQKQSPRADCYSLSSIIKAVATWAGLGQGRHLHAHALKIGFECDIYVGTALIDMYSKCGTVKDAHGVFSEVLLKNDACWSSMIAGYAKNGYSSEALFLFRDMQDCRVLPTSMTFTGILLACCQAGLVQEANDYYKLMIHRYEIPASIEHCTCMVNLLGRCGYVEEAEAFLNDSDYAEDPAIWKSLLSSCEIHENFDVGSRAAQQCLRIEPKDSSAHTILSNIYAAKKLWSEVGTSRDSMREIGVEKEPGYSWIEVRN